MFQIIKRSDSHVRFVFRCILLKIHARESVGILKKIIQRFKREDSIP